MLLQGFCLLGSSSDSLVTLKGESPAAAAAATGGGGGAGGTLRRAGGQGGGRVVGGGQVGGGGGGAVGTQVKSGGECVVTSAVPNVDR